MGPGRRGPVPINVRSVIRTYRAAFGGLPLDLWIVAAVLFVNRAGGMVLPFISLYLTQDRGLTVTHAGWILALYGLGATIGSYVGGQVSDRIGADRTMALSLAGSAVLYVVVGLQCSIFGIGVGVFFLSIIAESFRPACMSSMAHRAPEAMRVRAFALLRLAANLGIGIGPAVGGWLALYDYLWIFLVDAASCVAALVLLWRALPPAPAADFVAPTDRAGRRAISPWRDVPFLLLSGVVLLVACCFFQVFSTLPVYFREQLRFRESTIGLLLGLNAMLIVVFEMVITHFSETCRRMRVVALGAFLVCAGMALIPLGGSVAWIAVTIVVWTTGEMLVLPATNAVIADRAPRGARGHYMGIYATAFSLAFILAPALGSFVYGRVSPTALWYGIGMLGPLLAAAALALSSTFPGSFRAKATDRS